MAVSPSTSAGATAPLDARMMAKGVSCRSAAPLGGRLGTSRPTPGAALNDLNPVDFGPLPLGEVSQPQDSKHRPLHLWNDKGGGARKTMETVELALKDSLGGDTGQFIAGTAGNGF